MIRVGLTRWGIEPSRERLRDGRVEYSVRMYPQASAYRVPAKIWSGINSREEDVEISLPEVVKTTWEDYGYISERPSRELEIMKELSEEVAGEVVEECMRKHILTNQGYDKLSGVYIVKLAIMKAVQSSEAEDMETVDRIDLVKEINDIVHERARARGRAAEERERARKHAVKTSYDMLYEYLSGDEVKEAKDENKITVKNEKGVFVIPVAAHGLVDQFVGGEYVTSHCVIFKDWSIPIGDEVLMKVLMLKANPDRFLKVSNNFKRPDSRALKPRSVS